jgi:2-oxoglutarate dehydrogenase complex dehydrogenase (E1) component-like enzyme
VLTINGQMVHLSLMAKPSHLEVCVSTRCAYCCMRCLFRAGMFRVVCCNKGKLMHLSVMANPSHLDVSSLVSKRPCLAVFAVS